MPSSTRPKKLKISKPVSELKPLKCRACGEYRVLDDFRLFALKPDPSYMDFCVHCERRESTVVLYRRYTGYATSVIAQAVFAADRTPVLNRSTEQVRLLVEAFQAKPATNEEIVQLEVRRRELARRNLIYFTTMFVPNYKPGWVHHDIARRLERFMHDVAAGKSPRLIIAMPPRHGKSQLASDIFPSWALGHHPDWGIIGSSFAQSLPLDFSRAIRDRMGDPDYKAIFPDVHMRAGVQGVESWKTSKNGGYIAAGVGTGINGKGMHIGILDDALKDAEAADSETIRNSTFAWYNQVFRLRLAPGGGVLIIATRWHYADPTGKVLDIEAELIKNGVPPEERENWDMISYPAIAEQDEFLLADGTIRQGQLDVESEEKARLLRRKGDALHPERYTVNDLRKIKHGMPPLKWSALFQQSPTPDDGDFFKKNDIKYRWLDPAYRPLCNIFLVVDYAITKKQRSDYTVAGVIAQTSDDDMYLLGMRRGRWKTFEIVQNIMGLIEEHSPTVYAGEQGQIHHAVWPVIEQALSAHKPKPIYISVDETLVPIQDKEVRARPLQARTQRGKLYLSFDTADVPDDYAVAVREMLQFPNGLNDDCVDMLAWGARLAQNLPLPAATTLPNRPVKSWKDDLVETAQHRSFMGS